MKANGRRAWRKWAKRARWSGQYNWNNLRRHPWVGVPPLVPPTPARRPFSPRSLVGQTMGVRKRQARRAKEAALSLLAGFGKQADPIKLAMLRPLYRIGERLRPCNGAAGCFRCRPVEDGTCSFCHCEGCECDPQRCSMPGCPYWVCLACVCCGSCPECAGGVPEWQEEDGSEVCDGSGVLPARRPRG